MSVLEAAATTRRRRPPRDDSLLARVIRHRWDYMYVLPAMGALFLVVGYPLVYTIYLSFFDTPASRPEFFFVGLENYQEILSDERLLTVTWNTVVWTVGSTGFAFIVGTIVALLVHRDIPGRAIIRGALMIPYVIGYVVVSYIWKWIYHSDFGVLSQSLIALGVIEQPIIFLDSTDLVMPALILANVWKWFPFVMIMMLAGLQTVPEQLYNAARVDGANAWQRFTDVTVPHLLPVITITTILLVIGNINSFALIFIMTGGGPAFASQIWITHIYVMSFQSLRFGLASAYSMLLFLVMASFAYFYVKAMTGGSRRRVD
jgi:multiple sugar transport system permease protein